MFDVMFASSGGSRLDYNMCDNIIVRVLVDCITVVNVASGPFAKDRIRVGRSTFNRRHSAESTTPVLTTLS
jgi:hypothetical protein